ncbi:MAG: hypothetical protein GY928_31800 [Colwellia sp.]|nr:hypothetical protein [Colwellia sp.]
MHIDTEAFELAISKIDDGIIFEEFGLKFLGTILSYDFIPVGGTKDKGIDAFQHLFSRKDKEKIIYQLSTELDHEGKIVNTIEKLNKNSINFTKMHYVTNRKINNAERIVDELFEKYKVPVTIWDIRWFKAHSNDSDQTIRAYQAFVETYLNEYSRPGKIQVVANLETDSRLYVFLRQQFDSKNEDFQLDSLLADTLILYALEGTDPEKNNLKALEDIKEGIKNYIKFDPKLLEETLRRRLEVLSTKPRKIKYHSKLKGYCLPYETRLEIEERNLKDEVLLNEFNTQTECLIKRFFNEHDVQVKNIQLLITNVFHKIFEKQGLEFSNFVLNGDSKYTIEQELADAIAIAVDESSVVLKNKEKVKTAIHLSIREIIYNGSQVQLQFLKSLSNTYLMMFLLQWEPKITTYFQTLASNLIVFVDNSIIIPALSEYYLQDENKRHWNLLVGAKKSGISLFINETLLNELVHHFKMISNIYNNDYSQSEAYYLNEEYALFFIDEILIRSYFYSKKQGLISSFDGFLNNFITLDEKNVKEDLIVYLQEIFGITYISNEAWDINTDDEEKEKLIDILETKKGSRKKAKNDAEMILSIYYLRNKNSESSRTGIFGYKTWWLSKDTKTFNAVEEVFGDKYPVSCYIRPDFIYNYIALKPNREEVTNAYKEIFPTMLGVNLSYHMPKGVSEVVKNLIQQYRDKPEVRIKQILKNLGEKLKSDSSLRNKASVKLYLDEELKKYTQV